MKIIKNILCRIRGTCSTEELIKRGMHVGNNFVRMNNVIIDDSHAWLIYIGNNVTLASRVQILAHDASTKQYFGYTKIGRVNIGNNVFVGAESVILPGVSIGNDVIIGANSTITKDIPDGMVVAGSPSRIICTTEEYVEKERERMNNSKVYDESFTLNGRITEKKKKQQKMDLEKGIGYVR